MATPREQRKIGTALTKQSSTAQARRRRTSPAVPSRECGLPLNRQENAGKTERKEHGTRDYEQRPPAHGVMSFLNTKDHR